MLGIFIIIFLMGFTSQVLAANIGVSPVNIDFKNVLRGGYSERTIVVTVDTEEKTGIKISKRGEIADWINYQGENLSVSNGNPAQILVSVTPPEDTPNGNYSGFIRIESGKTGNAEEGKATGLVIPVLDIYVTVEVTDQEIFSCQASNFQVFSAEEGEDIIFTMDVANRGNIKIFPQVTIDIWNQDSTELLKEVDFSEKQIIPTQKDSIVIKVPSDGLDLGQYWADIIAVDCFAQQTLTFDILEEGALRAEGILTGISVTTWAEIGDIVPILVGFKNTGEKPLSARFEGKIVLGDKIVQLLESDEDVFVPLDGEGIFNFYTTPQQAGKYIISGRVFYNGKRTYEKSGILNVLPSKNIFKNIIKWAAYIILIIVIGILLYKIRNERRSYFRKLRSQR